MTEGPGERRQKANRLPDPPAGLQDEIRKARQREAEARRTLASFVAMGNTVPAADLRYAQSHVLRAEAARVLLERKLNAPTVTDAPSPDGDSVQLEEEAPGPVTTGSSASGQQEAVAGGPEPVADPIDIIEWNDVFNLDVPSVDAEHRHLFALVKSLNSRTVAKTLHELRLYVLTHFSNEQALMKGSNYPHFEEHLRQHRDLARRVTDFCLLESEWSPERTFDLRRFMNKWLVDHILVHDQAFGCWYDESRNQRA